MAARGFTSVEILIVLVIGAIIVAIAIPAIDTYVQRTRLMECITAISDMSATIKQAEKTSGALAATLADVGYDGKLDPWGKPYEYFNHRTSTGNGQTRKDRQLKPLNSDFELYSVGRDGLTSSSLTNSRSRDDVVRARDGRFIGTAEEFDP